MAMLASGRSIEKLATLLTTNSRTSPVRNCWNSFCRSATVVWPVIRSAFSLAASRSNWSRYCPITRVGSPTYFSTSASTIPSLEVLVDARR